MAIWTIRVDMNKYCGFRWIDISKGQEWYGSIMKAKPVKDVWTSLSIEYDTTYHEGLDVPPTQGISNFISLGTKIVLDQKALNVILPLVSEAIEALPIVYQNEEFYFMNVVNVLNCLDHTKSEFTRFLSRNIKRIDKYVFKESCLDNQHIFRLSETNYSKIYVSDAFKLKVEESHLLGLLFHKATE